MSVVHLMIVFRNVDGLTAFLAPPLLVYLHFADVSWDFKVEDSIDSEVRRPSLFHGFYLADGAEESIEKGDLGGCVVRII